MTTAFLFPGQGSQSIGMAEDFCQEYPAVARLFAAASDRLAVDLRQLMAKGPPRRLAETRLAQPVIFVMGFAIATLLTRRGIRPKYLLGHSLGEFTAAAFAGALAFDTALDLVIERGRLMHAVNARLDAGMLAVNGLPAETVERLIAETAERLIAETAERLSAETVERLIAEPEQRAWIANVNAASQIVVSGLRPALLALERQAKQIGARCTWLDVAGPYHTPLMAPAARLLADRIDCLAFRDPDIPVIGNGSAEVLDTAASLRAALRDSMLRPVRWMDCLHRARELGCEAMIETGPGRVMKGLVLRNGCAAVCLTTGNLQDFQQTCQTLEVVSCVSS